MRLDAAIAAAAKRLACVSESARLDAELLLCQTIDMPRSYLFAHPEDTLDPLSEERFEARLTRRLQGEPMAYITGTREFWSHELQVSPATLVPRPETELLVELALRELPRKAEQRVLELGTGSGAIAIAIAAERPLCNVTATDVSEAALAMARENVRHLNIANIECLQGDWTAPVSTRSFDLIVSNPPYVEEDNEALKALCHEPRSALAAGADGLDALRVLARDCPQIIEPGGKLLLEHGAAQEEAVERLLLASGWQEIRCHKDLAGKPRVTVARRNGK